MGTTIEHETDWTLDPVVVEARKRLADAAAIHEQRERERALLWEGQFSEDPFLRARFRSEWPQADGAWATAEAYLIQARQRLAKAEQEAKAHVQPAWDQRFLAAWADIEAVVNGPLMEAMRAWQQLAEEAVAAGITVPVALPENLTLDAIPVWVAWVRGQLQLDR
jgi:hypothetical protein